MKKKDEGHGELYHPFPKNSFTPNNFNISATLWLAKYVIEVLNSLTKVTGAKAMKLSKFSLTPSKFKDRAANIYVVLCEWPI